MSEQRITRISLAERGKTKTLKGETDWHRLEAMDDLEVRRAAESDPDAQPLTARQLATACRVPEVDVREVRRRRNMSQAAFANSYGLTLDAVQDWEQGRRPPNRYARILLAVIDREPEAVKRALAG